MNQLYRTLRTNPTVKRLSAPIYQRTVQQVRWLPPPKVLVNSFPKAGTHLLTAALQKLPRLIHSGHYLQWDSFIHGTVAKGLVDLDLSSLARTWERIPNGQMAFAHFPFLQGLDTELEAWGVRTVVMIRDPRDVVVSQTHYVANRPDHPLYARYRADFSSDEARLMASITGFPEKNGNDGLASIGARLEAFEGWLSATGVLVCRFEDLIGPRGGGSHAEQIQAVQDIARHVERPLSYKRAEKLADQIFSPRSATFRTGQIQQWKRVFTENHQRAFAEIAEGQMNRLGYS